MAPGGGSAPPRPEPGPSLRPSADPNNGAVNGCADQVGIVAGVVGGDLHLIAIASRGHPARRRRGRRATIRNVLFQRETHAQNELPRLDIGVCRGSGYNVIPGDSRTARKDRGAGHRRPRGLDSFGNSLPSGWHRKLIQQRLVTADGRRAASEDGDEYRDDRGGFHAGSLDRTRHHVKRTSAADRPNERRNGAGSVLRP